MKYLFFLLLLLCLGVEPLIAQSIQLPNSCKKILNKEFRGWKFAKIPNEVNEYHKERKFPFEPNLIKGDWNGDGKIDYAVLIQSEKWKNSEGKVIENQTFTIAFVKTKKGFNHFKLEGGDYIQIFKKGEKDYNYDSQKDFIYKNDSIFVGLGECCGSSYIWKNGKFIGFVTSD